MMIEIIVTNDPVSFVVIDCTEEIKARRPGLCEIIWVSSALTLVRIRSCFAIEQIISIVSGARGPRNAAVCRPGIIVCIFFFVLSTGVTKRVSQFASWPIFDDDDDDGRRVAMLVRPFHFLANRCCLSFYTLIIERTLFDSQLGRDADETELTIDNDALLFDDDGGGGAKASTLSIDAERTSGTFDDEK